MARRDHGEGSPPSVQGRHLATMVCGWRGHVTPAAQAERLEGPLLLGVDVGDDRDDVSGWRLARCLRCDAWIAKARCRSMVATITWANRTRDKTSTFFSIRWIGNGFLPHLMVCNCVARPQKKSLKRGS